MSRVTKMLNQLGWYGHNSNGSGMGLSMINDVNRNLFYEKIISNECLNRSCIDIGCGNGILTYLAVIHGAKHVYCFEKNKFTMNFFKQVVKDLKIEDKVTLINDEFKLSKFNDYEWNAGVPEIAFHEIMSSNIFNDPNGSLPDIIDKKIPNLKIIPESYHINIKSIPIDIPEMRWFSGLSDWCNNEIKTGVSNEYDAILQKYRNISADMPYKRIKWTEDSINESNYYKESKLIHTLAYNINDNHLFPDYFSIDIGKYNGYRYIFVNFAVSHNDNTLEFNAQTHFSEKAGLACCAFIVNDKVSTFNLTTDTGKLWFQDG